MFKKTTTRKKLVFYWKLTGMNQVFNIHTASKEHQAQRGPKKHFDLQLRGIGFLMYIISWKKRNFVWFLILHLRCEWSVLNPYLKEKSVNCEMKRSKQRNKKIKNEGVVVGMFRFMWALLWSCMASATERFESRQKTDAQQVQKKKLKWWRQPLACIGNENDRRMRCH